jgi:hypothetical protein
MRYTTQAPAHPRAGMAIGAAVIVGWLGAIGVAIASDDSPVVESRAVANGAAAEAPAPGAGRAAAGFQQAWAD